MESGRAHLALGLAGGGAGSLRIFAWRTLGVGDAGVDFGAVARLGGCKESCRTRLARDGGVDCIGMFTRRTRDVLRPRGDGSSESDATTSLAMNHSDVEQHDTKESREHGHNFCIFRHH